MRSSTARRAVVVLATIAMQLVTPGMASATNFGSQGDPGTGGTTSGVWLTPNSSWAIAKVNLTAAYGSALFSALGDYVGEDLHVQNGDATPVTSCTGSSGWDLCVFDSDYGDNGLVGWNACAGLLQGVDPNQKCTMDWVRLNQHYSRTANQKRSDTCHEIAHAWGLRHPNPGVDDSSCINPFADNLFLTTHDKNHLNANY